MVRVAARRGQQLFMLVAALAIFAIVIGVDHLWTNNAFAEAKTELEREEEEAKKLEADIQRKNELENELKQVEERIKVIKQLRAELPANRECVFERGPGRRRGADGAQHATVRLHGLTDVLSKNGACAADHVAAPRPPPENDRKARPLHLEIRL